MIEKSHTARRLLATQLKRAREKAGISQSEVAGFLQLPQSAVSRIEGGEREVKALELRQLARLFRSDPESFIRTIPSPAIALFTPLKILHPSVPRFPAYLYSELMDYFGAAGYSTRLYQENTTGLDDTLDRLLTDVVRGEICGVVSTHATGSSEECFRRLAARQIPLVGDSPHFPHSVSFPYRPWMAAAVRHLISQGRRRLALLSWDRDNIFRAELAHHGLDQQASWIRGTIYPKEGAGWTEMHKLWALRREKPDGLIIADDHLAPDACQALLELGVDVPGQLMVLSHANAGCPLRTPLPMVKLEYDTPAHARTIGGLLLSLLRGEPVAEPQVCGSDRFAIQMPESMKKPLRRTKKSGRTLGSWKQSSDLTKTSL